VKFVALFADRYLFLCRFQEWSLNLVAAIGRAMSSLRSVVKNLCCFASSKGCKRGRRPLQLLHKDMKRTAVLLIIGLLLPVVAAALESGQFRLLSVAETQKWILVSQAPGKPRYILDASTAKITVDNKPAEIKDLGRFSVINVKFELKKAYKDGINLDGTATEIRVLTPEQPVKKQ